MTCLTDQQILTVREHVGSETISNTTDLDILDRAETLATSRPLIVARSLLRQKLADLEATPQWSLSGDYNENWSANRSNLRNHILELSSLIAAEDAGLTSTIPGAPVLTSASLGLLVPDGQFRTDDNY